LDEQMDEQITKQMDKQGNSNGYSSVHIPKHSKQPKESKPINISFESFWDYYDKKEGSKANLEKLWTDLTDKERSWIAQGLDIVKSKQSDKQYLPNPENFLKGRYWENESY
jgi:hypothetical protein